jgi:CheY-like chemotaxis protein
MEKMLRRLIGEDVELKITLDPAAAKIKADQGQIEQVIMNLVVNARDAMPEGGRLTIETGTIEMDEEFVKRYPYPVLTGPYVQLTVSDTGIGMDAVTQQRIFEPFFTTKEKGKGTGLGLSTVYGVVKQSGGYIDVRSSPGKGTTFEIYIPQIKEAAPLQTQSRGSDASLHGTETVLLVEDEAALRAITRSHLEHLGYCVVEASNGREALERSGRYSDPIHILLTDMIMPELGGRALAQELGRSRQDLKVIYMSGYSGRTYNSQSDLDPGSFFLQKPFTRDGLARKIREALTVSNVSSNPGVG